MESFKFPEVQKVCLKGHQSGVLRSISFNNDGKYCLTTGSDRTVQLWNPDKNISLKTYSGHGHEVLDACSSSDNSLIASGSKDKSVIVWDVLTGQASRRLRGHHGQINCVRFNNDENSVLFSGSSDNTVCCWDLKSKSQNPIQILNHAKDGILSLDVYKTYIMSGSVDTHTRIYDLRQGRILQDAHGSAISSCKFAFEGNAAVISLSSNEVKLFDFTNGKNLMKFSGHKCEGFKIESKVVYKDKIVASGSEDGHVYFWDVVSGKILKKLYAHDNVVFCIAFHPDHDNNGKLLTLSSDKAIYWTN